MHLNYPFRDPSELVELPGNSLLFCSRKPGNRHKDWRRSVNQQLHHLRGSKAAVPFDPDIQPRARGATWCDRLFRWSLSHTPGGGPREGASPSVRTSPAIQAAHSRGGVVHRHSRANRIHYCQRKPSRVTEFAEVHQLSAQSAAIASHQITPESDIRCKLTGNPGAGVKAHVIPRAFYNLYDYDGEFRHPH